MTNSIVYADLPESISKEFYGDHKAYFGALKYRVVGDESVEFDTKSILQVFTKDLSYVLPLPSIIVLASWLTILDILFIHHHAKEYVANKYLGLSDAEVLANPSAEIDANIILEAKRLASFCASFSETILAMYRLTESKNRRDVLSVNPVDKRPEQEVSNRLQKKLGGIREDINPSGVADLVTDKELIEVKNCINWQQAVGQILDYAQHYPNKTMRIHLFGAKADTKAIDARKVCTPLNIEVTYEKC